MRIDELKKQYKRKKLIKLIASIAVDLIGNATYMLPVLGEGADVLWAFISGGILMFALYPNHKLGATFGGIEELIPGTDIVPTATLLWINDYIIKDKKSFEKYVQTELEHERRLDKIVKTT